VSAAAALIRLHDLDLLLAELREVSLAARLRRAGFALGDARDLDAARARRFGELDPRWRHHYERAGRRYGAAVASVRGRVCQGCYMTLPRTASRGDAESVSLCESCGRILYRGRAESEVSESPVTPPPRSASPGPPRSRPS